MRKVPKKREKQQTGVFEIVYGEEIMFHQMVGRWCYIFSERSQSVKDEGRSGRPSTFKVSERRPHYVLVVLRPITCFIVELPKDTYRGT
ncbi:hypothetical protein TNCV_4456641 [Trichonephila clavipes]|nr:hypothetical protein TNCV_4456641 [Trichonephila clavipes]